MVHRPHRPDRFGAESDVGHTGRTIMSVEILTGDCRQTLKTLADNSVHCCVTSPPYFGLRDYGHDGQIGLEQTPEEFVSEMVSVFREIRRVLREDGTLWLNLGDSYYNYRPGKGQALVKQSVSNTKQDLPQACARRGNKLDGLKEKDLIGIPWRVAFALQADGWYLRQDIIWHKPNPMPESVQDRCTKAHEYIFLLTKSKNYFYDAEAIEEESSGLTGGRFGSGGAEVGRLRQDSGRDRPPDDGKRNKRSVWTVNTSPYKGAHFATFPPDLIRPCILAGCPLGGTVLDPFGGSGTTGQVAMEEGRKAILCELNPEYVKLIDKRLGEVTPSLFGQIAA
jgi:DNA modification methylase